MVVNSSLSLQLEHSPKFNGEIGGVLRAVTVIWPGGGGPDHRIRG